MKKLKMSWLALLLCLGACLLGICFVGCKNNDGTATVEVTSTDDVVAITVIEASHDATLLNAMEGAQENGKLTFTISDGMVTSINGISQTTNTYWMLYTSDTENANTAWGVYVYNGQELGSAVLGAERLTVKNGCVYVWVYTKF